MDKFLKKLTALLKPSKQHPAQPKVQAIGLRYKNLIRTICHEVNNQLALIDSASQIAQSEPFCSDLKEQKNLWLKVEKASEKLQVLITNMHAFEILQEPKRINKREVKLIPLIEETLISCRQKAEQKNIKLVLITGIDEETKIIADPQLLIKACLKKILKNALEYTPVASSIRIKTKLSDSFVSIDIEDEGEGLPKRTLENLHGYDFMNESASHASTRGEALSLSIIKLILEEHQGKLEVHSKDKGTLIRLKIPSIID